MAEAAERPEPRGRRTDREEGTDEVIFEDDEDVEEYYDEDDLEMEEADEAEVARALRDREDNR